MKQVNTIYINGKFETPHGSELLTLLDPVTEQDAAQVLLADEVDAQRAIAAASV
jgi:aldehyde dehydrogenase (NAD+)